MGGAPHKCWNLDPQLPCYATADDTKFFISFSSNNFSESIDRLLHVVKLISWVTSNLLCLNPSKTEFILIGLLEQQTKIRDPSISPNLESTTTHTFIPNSPVRNFGVIFDQKPFLSHHSSIPPLLYAYARP